MGKADINYDLSYTNFPQTAAIISWAYAQGGWMERPPNFEGDAYTNAPPSTGHNICMVILPDFLKKIARSIALYKFMLKLHKLAYTGIL